MECEVYWSSVEAPFGQKMRSLEGTIMKLGDIPPEMWPRDIADATHRNSVDLPPGTFVRLLRYTPWRTGMKGGNNFSIETLDGKYAAGQVHLGELAELDPLDKLALIEGSEDGPRC